MGAIERHVRELDRLGKDLALLDRQVAQVVLDNPAVANRKGMKCAVTAQRRGRTLLPPPP
jgi:hypothetical protein